MTDATKTTIRDPNLDLVRSVAILSVIAGHARQVIPGQGFLGHGVDVFFCLSGFLIGRIFLKEESRGFSFLRFWTDRWLRTIPPYFFVLFLGLGLGQSGISSSWWSLPQFQGRFWQYIVFVQNYGAISSIPGAPFGVSWSLCVEEQFYLALPILFVLVRSFAARALLLSSVVATAVVTRSVVNEVDWFYTS